MSDSLFRGPDIDPSRTGRSEVLLAKGNRTKLGFCANGRLGAHRYTAAISAVDCCRYCFRIFDLETEIPGQLISL